MAIGPTALSLAPGHPALSHDIIKASWRRCISDYRLDPSDRNELPCVPAQLLKVLHSEMAELLTDASAIVEHVRKIARDAGYVVLISNADGVIVRQHADNVSSQAILREGLALGSILHEQKAGTNGIGTCIISRQPVTICADAHFKEGFRKFTCSAAPIFGSDGRILAALDISGRLGASINEASFAQHFVLEAAQQIGLLHFKKQHKANCILALSTCESTTPLSTRALIAADEEGHIVGATIEGYAYLGVPDLQSLSGLTINDFLHVRLRDLEPLARHSVRFQTSLGVEGHLAAVFPERPSKIANPAAARTLRPSNCTPLKKVAGNDTAMQAVVALCQKIVDNDLPLLLQGETGTGKDTLARAIHAESRRANKPFISVNCAAIPASLLASELFGYAPGTFSGGLKDGKTGKIAASSGGTLFLDEIGDMPLELQAHLLRVLEERAVTPLGSIKDVPVDTRIICATNRDITELASSGEFRKDLYYRINGVQLKIPALRLRTDFEVLWNSIIEEELPGENICSSPEVLKLLRHYSWPGNIRELKNVIRFALASRATDRPIQIGDLPEYLAQPMCREQGTVPSNATEPKLLSAGWHAGKDDQTRSAFSDLRSTTLAIQKQRIADVLQAQHGNIAHAAEKLGISRSTLHRKIRDFEISSANHVSKSKKRCGST